MEFKVRLTRRKKNHRTIGKKDAGYKRVKIRGRKRWIKVGAARTAGAGTRQQSSVRPAVVAHSAVSTNPKSGHPTNPKKK